MTSQMLTAAVDVRQRTLSCLATLLRFHGLPMGADALGRELPGSDEITADDIVRLARQQDLKARRTTSSYDRLPAAPLPALAGGHDGSFFILGRCNEDKVLVHRGTGGAAEVMDKGAFEAIWDGTLVFVTRRATLTDFGRQFGISWFMRAIYKYRNLLSQVLLASFFLQIFALISPLFFQVVVDKVLVHRGMTTLDVLLIGLVTVSIFETVLGALRTYVFSHTTNRIDVELGARLFRHLVALPLAYFGARRVGNSVARVRELENVRQFITGSSLTLVIDLFFTVVFIAVMAWYSWWLTVIVLVSLPIYAGISIALTPLFRARVEEKFKRGAENQAFLVEAVTGIETLKAMAVEPQMQRRWEEQLAGYVGSSFRVANLGNYASQSIQLVSKLATAGILYFGAKAVIAGDLTVGELVAFNMLASRVSQPVLRLAQVWQDFHQVRQSIQRLGDILNTPAEPAATPGRGALPTVKGAIRFDHREVPLPHRRTRSAARGRDRHSRRPGGRHRRLLRLRQVHGGQAGAAPLRAGIRPRAGRRHRPCDGGRLLAAPPDRHRAAGERPLQPHGAREHRARRSRHAARPGGGGRQARRRARVHPAAAGRLRHPDRRTRRHALGRPAPAHRDRARVW